MVNWGGAAKSEGRKAIGDRIADATERLLYQAQWSADVARDRLLRDTIEVFGEEDGIGVVDETGFKKGTHGTAPGLVHR